MVEITFAPETLTDATATETASVSTTTVSSEVHPVYVVGDKYFAFDGTELAEVTKDRDGQYTLIEENDGEYSETSEENGSGREVYIFTEADLEQCRHTAYMFDEGDTF